MKHWFQYNSRCICYVLAPVKMRTNKKHSRNTLRTILKSRENFELKKLARVLPILEERMRARRVRRKLVLETQEYLRQFSSSKWISFLEIMSGLIGMFTPDAYDIFTFETVHNISFRVSQQLKPYPMRPVTEQRFASQMRTSLLHACNSPLSAIQTKY